MIMIMSIWSASILSILLGSLAFQAGIQKYWVQAEMDQFKGHWALVSGMNLASKAIAENPEPCRDSPHDNGYGHLALDGAWKERVSIHIEDEDAKLNLNLANEKLLKEFFVRLKREGGIRFEKDTKEMVKGILRWGGKKKNQKFNFLEELLLIDEVAEKDFEAFKNFVTVSTDETVFPAVNINRASEIVLGTVMGSVPGDEFRKRELFQKILQAREDAVYFHKEELEPRLFMEKLKLTPSAEMTGLVSQLMPYLKTDSTTFRVEVKALQENKRAVAVIRLDDAMIQPLVLFWHEE